MELSRIRELKEEIEEKEAQIEALRGALSAVSIPTLDGLPKAKSPLSSKIERLTAQIIDSERELENLRGELIEVSIKLPEEILERVKGRAAQVLIKRYCYGESYKEIAITLKFQRFRFVTF